MSKLKISLVGLGQRGMVHLKSLGRLSDEDLIEIAAIADPFEENLSDEKISKTLNISDVSKIKKFSNTKDLINDNLSDGIIFAMPPNQHNGEIELAAKKSIGILAEKPQSLFLDEILKQNDSINNSNTISTVGFQMRYDDGYTDIKKYLSNKWTASITMAVLGAVEGHGVKHTKTETLGGRSDRIWTSDKKWSGTSIVENGIHYTDIMRYWTNSDIKWVQANYTERPENLQDQEGSNPIAYSVVYGFENGCVANLLYTKPARSYFSENYEYIITTHSTVKFEDDYVAYEYLDKDWPPSNKPNLKDLRKVISKNPSKEPMMEFENTYKMIRTFVEALDSNDKSKLRCNYENSINSIASVLAANASNLLNGDKININEFITSTKFSKYRSKEKNLITG